MEPNKTVYKNRINMFDLSKGIAMLLILSVSTLHDYNFYRGNVLEYFWMLIAFPGTAALFLIMGYWYQSKTLKRLLWELRGSSLKMYGVAAAATIVAIPLFRWTIQDDWGFSFLKSIGAFIGYLLGYDNSILLGPIPIMEIEGMWYVLVYMIAIICLNQILQLKILKDNTLAISILVFLISVVGLALSMVNVLPYCLPKVLVAIQTVYYGYLLREKKFFNRRWTGRDWGYLIIGNLITIGIYVGLGFTVGFGLVFNRTFMLFAIPAGILLVRFGQVLQKLNRPWTNLLCEIGSRSIILMVIFSVESSAISWRRLVDSSFMPRNEYLNCIIVMVLRVIFYISVMIGSKYVMKQYSVFKKQKITKRKEAKVARDRGSVSPDQQFTKEQ